MKFECDSDKMEWDKDSEKETRAQEKENKDPKMANETIITSVAITTSVS